MKKIALLLVIALCLGGVPGFAMVHSTVDGFIQDRKASDLSPVQDVGIVMDGLHQGGHYAYDTVTKPISPVINPVKKVFDVTLESTKMLINKTYDFITFRHLRIKDSK